MGTRNVRLERLYADWEAMKRLTGESPLFRVLSWGTPPERYVVTLSCRGLVKSPDALQPTVSSEHQFEIYLHEHYPRIQPRLTWLTDIFHPNILSPRQNGGVCIGTWTPAESLDQLCVRIAEMVQFKSYNPNDALNLEAADWVRRHPTQLPIDTRPVLIPG